MESKKSIDKVITQVKQLLKDYDVKAIDFLVDESTVKERERFARYRIPVAKYIQTKPKAKQYQLRTSPKKKPPVVSPKKIVAPKKKAVNWNQQVEKVMDDLIEKVTIIKDLSKEQSMDKKLSVKEFFASIQDQIETFENEMN